MPDTDTNAGPYSVTPNLIDFGRNGGFVLTGPELTLIYHSEPHANDACAILNTAHAAGRAAAQADLDVAREALSVVVSIIPPGCICGNNGGGDCDWCSAVSTACAALAKLEAKP